MRAEEDNNGRKICYTAVIAVMVAAVALVLGVSYFLPTSFVTMDVNPSFIMSLNVYDKVIKIEPLNDEAKIVLGEEHIKDRELGKTLTQLINAAENKGYMKGEGEVVLTAVPFITTPPLGDINLAGVGVTVVRAGEREFKEARKMGLTPAKARLIAEYKKVEMTGGGKYSAEELKNMPIGEIKREIEICRGKDSETTTQTAPQSVKSGSKEIAKENTPPPVPTPHYSKGPAYKGTGDRDRKRSANTTKKRKDNGKTEETETITETDEINAAEDKASPNTTAPPKETELSENGDGEKAPSSGDEKNENGEDSERQEEGEETEVEPPYKEDYNEGKGNENVLNLSDDKENEKPSSKEIAESERVEADNDMANH